MPRSSRYAPGGMFFHVLNRMVGRRSLFDKPADFEAFERVLKETLHLRPMRVCGYCWMSSHYCVNRGMPFGESGWVEDTASRLGLAATLRPRGRPRKTTEE